MSTRPDLAFIHNPLDRVHPKRGDEAWIAEQRSHPRARCLVIAGEWPLYATTGNPSASALFPLAEAERLADGVGAEMFLGLDPDGCPVFARMIPPLGEAPPPEGISHTDLRSFALQGVVPNGEVSMAALARSMLAWHESHRFCSKCGAPSTMVLGGFRRDCPACGAQHFPRTDPVAIMLITGGDRALVARSARFPPGNYSALAGFMEPGETIEQAVRREVFEEAGIRVGRVTYHSSQPWPFPSSLMIGCYGEAVETTITIDPAEIEDAMWVTRDELCAALAGNGRFRVPPPIAIAHHLIRNYAEAGL